MHDQNCTGARKGDTEVYSCEVHVLCMKYHNRLKMDQVSLKVYAKKSKACRNGLSLNPIFIWPKVPLFKMSKCNTNRCLSRTGSSYLMHEK